MYSPSSSSQSPANTADPRCICVSDLSQIPKNAFHPSDTSFAFDTIRNVLSQRAGQFSELLRKEFVLVKANVAPRPHFTSIHEMMQSGEQQQAPDNTTNNKNNKSTKDQNQQKSFWSSLQKSFPLIGTTSANCSLVEAFAVARFSDLSIVGDIYQALRDKFEVRDPKKPIDRTLEMVASLENMRKLTSAAEFGDGEDDDRLQPTATASGTFFMSGGGGTGNNNNNNTTTTSGTFLGAKNQQFTPKMRKKAPLNRVLKFLASFYECHILVSVPPVPQNEFDENVVIHFAPSAFAAVHRQNRNKSQKNNANFGKNPRIVVLRASGDMIIRQNSTPNDEGVYVWNAATPSTSSSNATDIDASMLWKAAFLDDRLRVNEQQQKSNNNKQHKKISSSPLPGQRDDDDDHDDEDKSTSTTSDSSSDDDDDTSSTSDDDDSSTSSSSSNSNGLNKSTTGRNISSSSSSSATNAGTKKKTQQKNAASSSSSSSSSLASSSNQDDTRDTALIVNHLAAIPHFAEKPVHNWTVKHELPSTNVQSYFTRRGFEPKNMESSGSLHQSPSRRVDIIQSDDVAGHVQAEWPSLANLPYPTIDGTIGIGMLLTATVFGPSPLFKMMKIRFFTCLATVVLTLVFCSAYIGTLNPEFGSCCVEDQSPQPDFSLFVDGITTADVYRDFAKLFCPGRKALFEQKALNATAFGLTTTTTTMTAAPAGTTTTATATSMNSSAASPTANTSSNAASYLQCARAVCGSTVKATLRDTIIQAAKFGDSAGGPVEIAASFLFGTLGPAIVIFVGCIIIMLIEVYFAFLIARRLALKSQGIFIYIVYGINILLALFMLGEAAVLVYKAGKYRSDSIEYMTDGVNCETLSEPNARQLCLSAADCGVELRASLTGLSADTMMGLAATVLVCTIFVLVATFIPPLPSLEDQAKILPSRPQTLQFKPGNAAPDGIPLQTVYKLQHRIEHKVMHTIKKAVSSAELAENQHASQRVYGGGPPVRIPKTQLLSSSDVAAKEEAENKKKLKEQSKTNPRGIPNPQGATAENGNKNNNSNSNNNNNPFFLASNPNGDQQQKRATSAIATGKPSSNPNYKAKPIRVFSTTEDEQRALRLEQEEIERDQEDPSARYAQAVLTPEIINHIHQIAQRIRTDGIGKNSKEQPSAVAAAADRSNNHGKDHKKHHHHHHHSHSPPSSPQKQSYAKHQHRDELNDTAPPLSAPDLSSLSSESDQNKSDAAVDPTPSWLYRTHAEQNAIDKISKRLQRKDKKNSGASPTQKMNKN